MTIWYRKKRRQRQRQLLIWLPEMDREKKMTTGWQKKANFSISYHYFFRFDYSRLIVIYIQKVIKYPNDDIPSIVTIVRAMTKKKQQQNKSNSFDNDQWWSVNELLYSQKIFFFIKWIYIIYSRLHLTLKKKRNLSVHPVSICGNGWLHIVIVLTTLILIHKCQHFCILFHKRKKESKNEDDNLQGIQSWCDWLSSLYFLHYIRHIWTTHHSSSSADVLFFWLLFLQFEWKFFFNNNQWWWIQPTISGNHHHHHHLYLVRLL